MRGLSLAIRGVLLATLLAPWATGARGQSPLLQGRSGTIVQGQADAGMIGPLSPSLLGDVPPNSRIISSDTDQLLASLGDDWSLQLLPTGLIYRPYLAGPKEPRLCSTAYWRDGHGWMWDATVGGRVGLLRYGTKDPILPEGWQFDMEGAAFTRLDLEESRDVDGIDFRVGAPLTFRAGPWETKIGYFHICSHLGDEYMLKHPTYPRINYVRDVIVLGAALRVFNDLRLYAEADWAFVIDGGAKPWEFQFGAEYSPMRPTGAAGAPFIALNANLRQEVDFGGSFIVQTGWQWRGETGHLLRLGFHYMTGKNLMYQFYQQSEEQIGMGIWYDF